jgi:hypothetical protein
LANGSRHRGGWQALVAVAVMAAARLAGAQDGDSLSTQKLLDRVQALEEQTQTHQSDLDKLKRFKFSGYLQVRWETAEFANDSVKVAGSPAVITPANDQRFYIRRGRFKLTYDASPLSQAVIYFDGNTSGSNRNVTLLEAYLTLMDPWTADHRHQLTAGQFTIPFGWEIERSSSLRELPERSRAENVLFNGERDRGIKLVNGWTPKLETVVSVLNGYGINDVNFPTLDPAGDKDWTARARFIGGTLDFSASYYGGHTTIPLTGADLVADKTRIGGDGQLYYELPSAGGGSLRGEYYTGENLNADSLRVLVVAPTPANPVTLLRPGADPDHLDTPFTGGYVMWVQNLGEKFQLASRYDWFDPNSDLDHDQYERVSLGINWFYDGYTRLTVAYDIPKTDVAAGAGYEDPKDNLWTVQLQHKW